MNLWKIYIQKLCSLREQTFKGQYFLMNLLYERFTYTPKVTNINTTAGEAMELKKGVCQDYSHIL